MNRPTLQAHAPASALKDSFQQRLNDGCQKIVNQGISVQSNCSTVCAIEYLKCHDIAAEVIERVLLHPELRRKTPY